MAPENSTAPPSRTPLVRPGRSLLIGWLLLVAIIIGLVFREIGETRERLYNAAWDNLSTLNLALLEQMERAITATDQALLNARQEVAAMPPLVAEKNPARREEQARRLHQLLRSQVTATPFVTNLVLVDAQGNVLAHSARHPVPAMNVREREYFRRLRDTAEAEPLISPPTRTLLDGSQRLIFSRRLVGPRGHFAGVILASISLADVVSFYRSVLHLPGGAVALYHSNATLLARYPEMPDSLGHAYPEQDLFLRTPGRGTSGTLLETSSMDGRQRLKSFREAKRYPILVSVSQEESELLRPWRATTLHIILMGLGSIVLCSLFIGLIWRQLQRLEEQARALRESEGRFRNLVERAGDALFLHDPGGCIEDVNQQACDSLGLPREELIGSNMDAFEVGIPAAELHQLWHNLDTNAPVTQEGRHRHRLGHEFPVEMRIGAFASGGRRLILTLARDVTERQAYQEKLRQQALHDGLTGLPNRVLFNDLLGQLLAQSERQERAFALLFVDLDHFKEVNDTLGHAAGDRLLQEAAARLRGCLRKADTVARLGGDEFAVLLAEVAGAEDGEQVAEKIVAAMNRPFPLPNGEGHVSASIGIALYPEAGKDAETLLRHADWAMYQAKSGGRNGYRRYRHVVGETTLGQGLGL